MKSNEELMKNVLDAINWEPLLSAAEIGVMVQEGEVRLTGSVNTYAKKGQATKAVRNVAGVKKIFDDIVVVCGTIDKRTDAEIKVAIAKVFNLHWDIPKDKITVLVKDSWVFLSGEVEWEYQKEASMDAVKNLIGIIGITIDISIIKTTNDTVNKRKIENALERNDKINPKDIDVVVVDALVTLKGQVSTVFQKKLASIIARNVIGVKEVENDLKVGLDQ